MNEFKTYRVRFCEQRCLAINVSARSDDAACDLASSIYAHLGAETFEEIDGVADNTSLEAEEISGADLAPETQTPPPVKDRASGATAKKKRRPREANL